MFKDIPLLSIVNYSSYYSNGPCLSSSQVTTQAAEVNEAYRKYAQVSSQEGAILVEVPSVWDLVMVGGAGLHQDSQVKGSGVGGQGKGQSEQQQSGLGACEVVYSAKIDFIDVMERRYGLNALFNNVFTF